MGGVGVLDPRAFTACGAPGPTVESGRQRGQQVTLYCNRPAGHDGGHRHSTGAAVILAAWDDSNGPAAPGGSR